MVLSRLRRLLIPLSALCCVICFFGCKPKATADPVQDITDVSVHNTSVYFDDDFHGLDIIGLRDGDVVLFSSSENGEYSATELTYKDPGCYTIFIKVSRENHNDLFLSATLTVSVAVLDGISSSPTVVVHDGNAHNVSLDGLRDGDAVSYSLDGVSFSPELDLTDVGHYTVFFRVTRGFAEFRGSSALTILPSASGTYLNPARGVIRISGLSSSDGYTLSYDLSCSGSFGDKPFSFTPDSITVDGVRYDRIDDSADVYTLSVNGSEVLFFTQPYTDVSVSFSQAGATVSVGQTSLVFPDFNYCESINSIVNDGRSYGMSERVTGSDVAVVLSSRLPSSVVNPSAQCLYDGGPHAVPGEDVLFEIDGEFVSDPPSFTEVGTYTVRVLSLKPGYLPAYGAAVLVIFPSPDGTYYSLDDNVVISVVGASATKNGKPVPAELVGGEWLVDGIPLSRYSKRSTETLTVFYVNGSVAKVFACDGDSIAFLGVDNSRAVLLDSDFVALCSIPLSVAVSSVSFNGTPQTSIPYPDFKLSFGIGIDDLRRADGMFVINFCGG